MKKVLKKALKIILITLGTLLGVLLIAVAVVYVFFPDKVYELDHGSVYRMAGYELDTVHLEKYKAKRGDIVDCFGKTLVTCNERFHVYGNLAASTLGYVKTSGDSTVKSGIEGVFCNGLNGEDGYNVYRKNIRTGKSEFVRTVKKKDGPRVVVALDIELQAVADSVLRAKIAGNRDIQNACIVIATVDNGAIRTMANLNRNSKGEYSDSCNTAISFRYSPGMLLAPAAALAAVKCDTTKHLTDCNLTSKYDLCAMAADCDLKVYKDTLADILSGKYSDDVLEIEGLEHVRFDEDSSLFRIIHAKDHLSCGLGVYAPALNWLKLYTAIARDGNGKGLWLTGLAVDDDNVIINDCIMLASSRYTLCSTEQAADLKESLKRSLKDDILRDAKFGMAGTHGESYTPSSDGRYVNPYSEGSSAQTSFAGFFPADEPVYSIICMLHFSPSAGNLRSAGRLTSEIVKGIVDSDITADRVELLKNL